MVGTLSAPARILAYLNTSPIANDLRRSIQFSTTVTKAYYNEATDRWDVETTRATASRQMADHGLGLPFGSEHAEFKAWRISKARSTTRRRRRHRLDFAGKRVGVIGTGSTGVQVVSDVAPMRAPDGSSAARSTACRRRTSFNPENDREIIADLPNYFDRIRRSALLLVRGIHRAA